MPYLKRTRIWNNVFTWQPKPLCNKDCNSMNGNKHIATAQRGASGKDPTTWSTQRKFTQKQLYVIPQALVTELFNTVVQELA